MATLVTDVRLSPDGKKLLVICSDNTMAACYAAEWDLATGRETGMRMNHRDGVLSACYSPDGTKIGTGGEDYDAAIWEASDNHRQLWGIRQHGQVASIAFNRDATAFDTGSRDGIARIWSTCHRRPFVTRFFIIRQ